MQRNTKLTLDEIKEEISIINDKIIIISKEHINGRLMVNCKCSIDCHEWTAMWSNLKRGTSCPKCAGKIKLSLNEIKEKINKINPNIEIYEIYINKTNKGKTDIKCKCKCIIDGYSWIASFHSLLKGAGCTRCKNLNIKLKNSTPNGNSIRDMRPDLVKYLVNEDDADKYAYRGQRYVKVKCPECGMLKDVIPFDLDKRGFSCNYCSDGISVPEKFCISLLNYLKIEFKPQYKPNWSQRKRYDFYIPSLNMIIETHGRQHYEDIFSHMSKAKFSEEEQNNDKLKYNLAIYNGVIPENYIVIDCRYSELEWLKENFIKELSDIFNLDKIDWEILWSKSHSSIKKQVWDLWNNRETIKTIADKFNLSAQTIRSYLKIGDSIGMCKYNFKNRKN